MRPSVGARAESLDSVEDRVRDLLLRGQGNRVLTRALHDHDLVLGALEADLRARDVVEDDRVGALALQLLAGAGGVRIRFGGEADDRLLISPACRERGEDVLGGLEVEVDATALPMDLLA